jgi:PKD repeat protein
VYSNARNSYYNITGYPTYFFDGILSVVGGSGTSSMYSYYVPKVNARNAVLSDFTIDVQFVETDGNYTATITVDNVGGNTSTGLVLQVAITESHMPITWGLSDEVNFVNRLMVPNQSGTALDFSGGNTQVVELNFTTAGFWDKNNCEIVAFVQKNSTKEILQGTKKTMAVALYNLDAWAKEIIYPVDQHCGSSLEPVVVIKNLGSDNLTTLDINYNVNGGASQTFGWTGDLGFNLSEEVTLPAISFDPEANNTIEIMVSNPNGQPDPNPGNDLISQAFMAAPQVNTVEVNFELKTDQYPSETTWEVKNSAGTTVYSGGPYAAPNTIYTEVWSLPDADCYTFTIYDEYGDGICCAYGNGYYKLKDGDMVVFAQGGEFGTEETKPFERMDMGAVMADFTADITEITEGGTVHFTDLSTGGITTWNWTFEGGTPQFSTIQNPTVVYNVPGVYDVSLAVSNGINSNTIVKPNYITVNSLTGVNNAVARGIHIFPNPVTSKMFINGADHSEISIYNSTGNKVLSLPDFNGSSIDMSGVPGGIYLITVIRDGKSVFSEKINVLR